MKAAPADEDRTRHRLIEAAGEVFADRGFKDATVREICRRAGANGAAVNYHFGDKQTLYAAAVRYAHDCRRPAMEHSAATPPAVGSLPPERQLHLFLRCMLTGILDGGKPAWHEKLVAREMAEPTGVLQQIVSDDIGPRFQMLSDIVRAIVGPAASDELVRRGARSVVGQVLFYHFARPVLTRLFPDERFDATAVDALADHVAAFSIGGLRAMGRRAAVQKKPKGTRRVRVKG